MSKKFWKTDAITELRQTKKGYGEPKKDRFSVAPSVGRAYLACPYAKEGEALFVYQVHVTSPEITTDTADYETTQEHLVTDAVLNSEGRRIPVTLIGQVLVGLGERVNLLAAYRNWQLDMTHEEESYVLWNVVEGVWRFNRPSRDEAARKLVQFRESGKRA